MTRLYQNIPTGVGKGRTDLRLNRKSLVGVLEQGAAWAVDKGLGDHRDLEFLEADSQHLPFADDTFGCVTVAFGLRNVSDTDRGLQEMIRVCTPGGQVSVLEFSQPRLFGLRQIYAFYFSHVLPRVGQWFARNDKSAYKYLPESVGQFPCGQALADRMTQNGLTDVRFTPLTFGVATIYEGTKPESSESDAVAPRSDS